MTEGKIYSKISLFALPIFIGQLFQQFYNVADSLVVGRYLGKQALAAVSSSGSLIFLLVGFINGVFVGAGVVIGRYYGARENEKVHTAVHTTTAFAVLSGLFLTAAGMLLTPLILRLMNTPTDVLPSPYDTSVYILPAHSAMFFIMPSTAFFRRAATVGIRFTI